MSVLPTPTIGGAANAHGTVTSQGQNPWLEYFGPSNGPLVTQAYDKYAEENYDLPEAYRGKNLFLRDTIDGLITDGSQPVRKNLNRTNSITVSAFFFKMSNLNSDF
jgi:hypothetical protein